MLAVLGAALLLFAALWLTVFYRDSKTLHIGIFYGSNWEVPGTMHYDIFDQAIEKYKTEHGDVTVTYEEGIPSEEYSEWLSGNILTGSEPDVFIILDEDFQTLAAAGVLLLSGVIAKETRHYLKNLDEVDTSEIPVVDK